MLLHPYSPNWVRQFELLRQELDIALQGLEYSIEHVGSTAVPGLAAKPIIDIDIIYNNGKDFTAIKARLESRGYYHNGNQGIEDREVFKRQTASHHPVLDQIPHHLYVCLAQSLALERHLLTRDHLRRNEKARLKYQQMKEAIATQAQQDRKRYALLKEELVNGFIDEMIQEERLLQKSDITERWTRK